MSEEEIQNAEPLEPHRSDEAAEICYPDGRIEHPGVRHEPRDIRFPAILALIAMACAILAVLGYTIWRFYWFEAAGQEEVKASQYPRRRACPPHCRPSRGWSSLTGWRPWRVPTCSNGWQLRQKR